MKWGGLWCPCCGSRVRTKPRNSKFKKRLMTTRKVHNENKNKEQHLLLFYRKNDITANGSSLFVN
jgi:DNA-directed RNA polymerase subunit RPC12/RpoP